MRQKGDEVQNIIKNRGFYCYVMGITLITSSLVTSNAAYAQNQAMPAVQNQAAIMEQQNMKLSQLAADRWLKATDAGNYAEAWELSSNIFRFTVTREQWIKAQEKLRRPLGAVISRQLMNQRPAKDPQHLPAGDYMVLFYKTVFQNRPGAKELITMVLSTDDQWKVLTYEGS